MKNRDSRYGNLCTADFLSDEDAIQLIATEFEIGATLSRLEEAKPNHFGRDVLRIMRSPLFAIGFGGELELEVKGTVVDAADAKKSMEGARVDLYKTMLRITTEIKCFKSYANISSETPESDYEVLKLENPSRSLPVLEVRREPPEYSDGDLVKVKLVSEKLDYNEGWIVARWGNTHFAELVSVRSQAVDTVESDNSFSFNLREDQPYYIRVVKNPAGIHGYFDGAFDGQVDGLPVGWFRAPQDNMHIKMRPGEHMVQESALVDLLPDWIGYSYKTPAKCPAGYYVSSVGVGEATSTTKQVVCNPFVESLVVEAWHRSPEFGATFSWHGSQHTLAMIENRWDDVNSDFDSQIDIFSSVHVYLEQTITVEENPTSGTSFTIAIDNTDVEISAGVSQSATAANIVTTLNADPAVNTKVAASRNLESAAFVIVRSRTAGPEGDYRLAATNIEQIVTVRKNPTNGTSFTVSVDDVSVTITAGASRNATAANIIAALNANATVNTKVAASSKVGRPRSVVVKSKATGSKGGFSLFATDGDGDIEVNRTIEVSGTIEPAIEVDLSDPMALPPPWSALQGWSKWQPAKNPDPSGPPTIGIIGHNFFIVDVHPTTNRVLVLDSNVSPQNGPGLRGISHIDDARVDGRVTPNKDRHWIQKRTLTWMDIKQRYGKRTDGANPLGVVRLKVYDLHWAMPIL